MNTANGIGRAPSKSAQWMLRLGGTALVRTSVVVSCALMSGLVMSCSSDEEPPMWRGALCADDSECSSGYCEESTSPGNPMCCGVPCAEGTVCAPNGEECVPCDPKQAGCSAKRETGAQCEEDAQCSTEHCIVDVAGTGRCCDEACTVGCNANGRCLEGPAVPAPDATTPEGNAATAPVTVASNDAALNAGGQMSVAPTPMVSVTPPAAETVAAVTTAVPPATSSVPAAPMMSTPPPALPTASAEPETVKVRECVMGATRSCAVAGLKGNCADGKQSCDDGQWSDCSVLPAEADDCEIDGDDADCDGEPNSGCDCASDDTMMCEADGESEEESEEDEDETEEEAEEEDESEDEEESEDEASEEEEDEDESEDEEESEEEDDGEDQADGDVLWSFDDNAQGWSLRSTDPGSLKEDSNVSFNDDEGDPEPGSLLIEVPFDDSNQKAEFDVHMNPSLDVKGKQLRARVMLVSGLSTDKDHPAGIMMFAKAGSDFVYVSGHMTYLTKPGEWKDVVLDPNDPAFHTGEEGDFDLEDVREIGFELRTFEETEDVSDAVVRVDTVRF